VSVLERLNHRCTLIADLIVFETVQKKRAEQISMTHRVTERKYAQK
jgi:hypothetical protein